MEKHFTVTVYIGAKIKGQTKVLLHKHKKLNIWLGMGGHIEIDEDPMEALIREAQEETGLVDLSFIGQENLFTSEYVKQLIPPITIMEETVPAYKEKGLHKHVDLIYFANTKTPDKVKMDEEFGWFSKEELKKLDLKEDVKLLTKQIFNYLDKV